MQLSLSPQGTNGHLSPLKDIQLCVFFKDYGMILLPDKEELLHRGVFPIPVVAGMSHLQPHILFPLVTALLGCSSGSMGVAQRTGHTAACTLEAA